MKLIQLLLLPLCACAITACGGGGGGGGSFSSIAEEPPVFEPDDWAAHPGAEVEAEQSTTEGEVLAGKTMTVTRIASGGASDTTLIYRFTPGMSGSYTCTTTSGTSTSVITTYTYKPSGKDMATLTVDIDREGGSTHHEYTLSFSSAKSATGILSIAGASQDQLTVVFK